MRRDSARMAPKPAIPTSHTAASVPPQSITSARPSRIASQPSPIAMFDAAHAVHSESSGPRVPSSIETQPAPRFGMIAGIENGLTRSGPRSTSTAWHSWNDRKPADSGRDRGADPVGLPLDLEAGVGDRLPGRREDQVREAVHPPRLLAVDPLGRVEVLHLAGEVDRVVAVVELRDLARAGLACEQARPRRLDVEPERRHCAQPGDDDAPASVERTVPCSHYIPSPPSTSSTSPVMNDASSEQRKRTAPATSFGSPSRPSGVLPSIAVVASSGRTSVSCVRT